MNKFNWYRITKIILYTIAVMLVTLIIDSSRQVDSFISVTLPSWLTAIGTIAAVGFAVGQNVIHNRRIEKEYNERSANARKLITALLSTHKLYFNYYHDFRYDKDGVDLINEGNKDDLYELYRRYIDEKILKRAHECLDDIKFGIRNVGIQSDSATIGDLSDQINAVNLIETALTTVEDQMRDHFTGQLETNAFIDGIRDDLRIIDVSLQDLAKDLTDKDV